MTTVIVITAKRNGFRRCGVAHSDQPTTWQQDDFTDGQWDELIKEPQLFLAVEERDLGLGLEQHHAFTSSTALPEASSTFQLTESQASETVVTPVADPVGNATDSVLDDEQPGPPAPGATGADTTGNDDLLNNGQGNQAGDDGDNGQPSTDQQDSEKVLAKPEKAKAGKAKDAAK